MLVSSFPHMSHAGFIFIWGVSLIHPVLVSFLLLLLLFFFFFFFFKSGKKLPRSYRSTMLVSSFPHMSHAGFIFTWGVSFTHPMLA